jgi:uncharacterized protein with beta-barrel porin domain
VAPLDAQIFGIAQFAFGESNQEAASGLLGRTLANGGGGSFYNLEPPGGPETRGWIQGIGNWLDPAASARTPGFREASGGLEGGIDVAVGPGGRIGAAVGYEAGSLSDTNGGAANQDTVRVSLYGSQTFGPIGLSAALSYAHGWDQVDRASGFGPSRASFDADDVTGAVQVAAPFAAGGLAVSPTAGLLVSWLSSGGFVERNGADPAFAISGQGASVTAVSPFATIGLSHDFAAGGDGAVVTPDVQLGYRYDALADSGRITLVARDGTAFAGYGVNLNPNSALVGVSLTAHEGGWTGFIRYRATISSDWNNQFVEGGLRLTF